MLVPGDPAQSLILMRQSTHKLHFNRVDLFIKCLHDICSGETLLCIPSSDLVTSIVNNVSYCLQC